MFVVTKPNPTPTLSLKPSVGTDDDLLAQLQTQAFQFFRYEKEDMLPGLFPDNTKADDYGPIRVTAS